jgi:hypothetical protein
MLQWLLDTGPFLTRTHCGEWPRWLRIAYMAANGSIALAYFLLPVQLGLAWRRFRPDLPRAWVLLLFAAFILLCGVTHVFDVLVFYVAPYRLFTAALVATAAVSLAAAAAVPFVARDYRLASRRGLHDQAGRLNLALLEKQDALERLGGAYEELAGQHRALQAQIDRLEGMRRTGLWARDLGAEIDELRSAIRPVPDAPGAGGPQP